MSVTWNTWGWPRVIKKINNCECHERKRYSRYLYEFHNTGTKVCIPKDWNDRSWNISQTTALAMIYAHAQPIHRMISPISKSVVNPLNTHVPWLAITSWQGARQDPFLQSLLQDHKGLGVTGLTWSLPWTRLLVPLPRAHVEGGGWLYIPSTSDCLSIMVILHFNVESWVSSKSSAPLWSTGAV